MVAGLGSWGILILGPVLVTGTLVGLTGRTPGKLIMFLRVSDAGEPPGLAQGILREIIKTVSMTFFFLGPIWALQGLVTRGETFYDQWLDLQVEDLRPYGLSETQKNWRKFHRQQARQQKSADDPKGETLKQNCPRGRAPTDPTAGHSLPTL